LVMRCPPQIDHTESPGASGTAPHRWTADKHKARGAERVYAKRKKPAPKPDNYFPSFIKGRVCIELKRPITLAEWREWDLRANTPIEETRQTEQENPHAGGWIKLGDWGSLAPAQDADPLIEALDVLNGRQRRVFVARRLADEPMSLGDLAAELGVTEQRVQQLEVRAFEKVQKAMKGRADVVHPAEQP
jgi:DNA-directed RNA polymerase specialized sigma24 family protein